MGSGHLPNMERLERLTRSLDPPFAAVDDDALAHNAANLVRRAAGTPTWRRST